MSTDADDPQWMHREVPQVIATFHVYDESRLMRICHVDDAYSALNEMAIYLRHITKYDPPAGDANPSDLVESIKKRFWEICTDYNIDPMVD